MIAVEVIRRRRTVAAAAVLILLKSKLVAEQRKRRLWSRQWLLRRDTGQSVLNMVFSELGPEDPASFTNYTRMFEDEWNELLTLLTPHIKKQDSVMRQAISPRDRLTVTVRYLATGNIFQDLSYSTRIAPNTISQVVNETLNAIVKVLESRVFNFPSTPEEWQVVAHKFDTIWNFPHCIGALDGKHINFRPPRSDGSIYRNYKEKDSIVLLGLVDAEYKFLFVDIGRNGRMHDSAVFRESPLWTQIDEGTLNLPAPCELPGFCYKLPYTIVGDSAFGLKPYLMKPYPEKNLTLEKRIFNYRLSRARRTVGNAFGILANRWRVLLSPIPLCVEKVETITYACVLLHNYLIDKSNNDSSQRYVPHKYRFSSHNDSNCNEVQLSEGQNTSQYRNNNRSSNEAYEIRDKFCEYFNTAAGIVPFQYTAIEQGNY